MSYPYAGETPMGTSQPAAIQIPTLDRPGLWLLMLALAMVGGLSLRRVG